MLEYGNLQEDIKILPEPTNSDKSFFGGVAKSPHLPKEKKNIRSPRSLSCSIVVTIQQSRQQSSAVRA
jgi:hypothetical protein